MIAGNGITRILYQIGTLRRQQVALPLPVIDKARLVDGLGRDRPEMGKIQLLKTAPGYVAKSWQVGSARQETRERLAIEAIVSVIVEAELLLAGDVVVEAKGHLVLANFRIGCRTEHVVAHARWGNKLLQQIGGRGIEAVGRNDVARENSGIGRTRHDLRSSVRLYRRRTSGAVGQGLGDGCAAQHT